MSDGGSDPPPEYAILGCGSVGHVVANRLSDQGKRLVIYDKDESRVEALRDQDLNAVHGDVSDPEIASAITDTPVALVLTSFVDDNEEALRNLKEENPDQYVIVRATDPVSHEQLEEAGADYVINPPQVIAESALRAIETGELEHRASQLADLLKSGEDAAVVVYRSFEPDSIAAASAVQAIAERFEVDATVVYDGDHRHSRGETFANLVGVEVEDAGDLGEYDNVVVIGRADEDRPPEFDVSAWIDHDGVGVDLDAEYTDVGANTGSNSTTLTRYLQEVGVDTGEHRKLLTGLLHGIRTKTRYFRRNATPSDLRAAAYLYPLADHDLLDELESTSRSPEEFDVLAQSIINREVHSSYLVSNVGFINDADTLGRAADSLLGLEAISTTVVFGVVDESIHVAAQSNDVRVNIERVLKKAFEQAEVVGHTDEAHATVDLGLFGGVDEEEEDREMLLELVDETVKTKVLRELNVEDVDEEED